MEIPTLTKEQKMDMSHTEIAKCIKSQLSAEYPNCTWSVSCKDSSITVALMVSDRKVVMDFADIPEIAISRQIDHNYTIEQLKALQLNNYHQLGGFRDEYKSEFWSNGVFLTKEGYEMLQRAERIADAYNWDHSDIQSDYFDVHFYFDIHLGKWDKPFVDFKPQNTALLINP